MKSKQKLKIMMLKILASIMISFSFMTPLPMILAKNFEFSNTYQNHRFITQEIVGEGVNYDSISIQSEQVFKLFETAKDIKEKPQEVSLIVTQVSGKGENDLLSNLTWGVMMGLSILAVMMTLYHYFVVRNQ